MVLRTLDHSISELHLVGEVHIAVALHIGLGEHIDTVFVAEVVEVWVVGIVRGADGVDVDALHVENLLLDFLVRDCAAGLLAEVVTVDTAEQNASAVYGEGTVIADTNLTETDFAAAHINDFIAFLKGDDHVVELRGLGTP